MMVSAPNDTPDSDRLLDEALDWVVRFKTGRPTKADADALQEWRGRSAAHEQAFRSAVRIFRHAGLAAQELAKERSADQFAFRWHMPRPPVLARRAVLGGAIAAGAGYLAFRPPLDLWPSLGELSADYRTGKGEQRKLAIAPDISLELNTQTSIALRTARNETEIELITGEASVTKRPSAQPFVMVAANGRITAAQADFNARCLDGSVSVTCLDGMVTVERGRNSVQLHKAEQVSYSGAGLGASLPVDSKQVTAWQSGLLIFRDRPLGSVVDEVNRYRPGKIIITNAELSKRLVNGSFQLNKLDNFVAQVQQLFGAHAITLVGGVVLLS